MNTKQKIIRSAIEVFAEKGRHGATVEEIAKKAGVNKAMVYYYYDSKQNLLLEVITAILDKIMKRIVFNLSQTVSEGDNPVSNVKHFISAHFRAFSYDNKNSKILLDVLANDPGNLQKAMERLKDIDTNSQMPTRIMNAFIDGNKKGVFRDLDYMHVIICFIGMCITWFIFKPIAKNILSFDPGNEEEFLVSHEKAITDIMLNGIVDHNVRA